MISRARVAPTSAVRECDRDDDALPASPILIVSAALVMVVGWKQWCRHAPWWWLVGCAGPTPLDLPSLESSSGDEDTSPPAGDSDEPPEPEPIDPRDVVEAATPPPPIYGGTLLVLDDGRSVVVADPDRGVVHVVDAFESASIAIDVGAESEPWRAAQTTDGLVHVTARGTGELLTIDPSRARLLGRRAICRHPRGIAAFDAATVVACADGELWRLAGPETEPEITHLEPDLRDVFFDGEGVMHVTRFRSAEVLRWDDALAVFSRFAVPSMVDGSGGVWKVSTAWRSIAMPSGWLMLHQLASDQQINLDASVPYGGHSAGCNSVVQTQITAVDGNGSLWTLGRIHAAALVVDVALDASSGTIALAIAAGCGPECVTSQVAMVDAADLAEATTLDCISPTLVQPGPAAAQMTAVGFLADGSLAVQQREPSALHLVGPTGDTTTIDLGGASVEDTGHRLFHETAIAAVSCASCHPEGGDDGQVWWLDQRRHTQSMDVGLAGTAPFHWIGDLEDFDALAEEVHQRRMGALPLDAAQADAFERWVTHRRIAPSRTPDELSAQGEREWTRYGCARCHVDAVVGGTSVILDADNEALQVPSLFGVDLHPPWMHDGRSHTLADAVREMIVRTTPGAAPTPDEIAALVAYLETL